ncbi:ABC transporter substrate-binding protein [Bellilinea sp.]|jgi:iron complex transport system substrate-binding protein|uniref:ABC transporter substrate-binding protein n=1 Tax=Bellilinea caldifistulae TaxID=360411 RepID=A0A7C4Q4P2_9CHLR
MKRQSVLLSVLLLLALLVSACTSAATPAATPTASPIVMTDGLGRTVTLAQPAQRVVSLAPSNTEILFAVGAGSQVVGRDNFSNYPPEALELPGLGDFMGFSIEQIVALNPDLVLLAEIHPPELVKSLEDAGLTVYYLKNPLAMEEMYPMLITVGELTGHKAEAEALVTQLSLRVAVVQQKLANIEERPTVFYEIDGTDPSKPWTTGSGTFIDTLLEMAKAENVGRAMDSQYGQMSIEALLAADPDFILLGDANFGVTPEQVAARPGWGELTAVKEGRVLPFNDDLASRPGPRLVDGLEELARLLHGVTLP